jgi:hypothetical protein
MSPKNRKFAGLVLLETEFISHSFDMQTRPHFSHEYHGLYHGFSCCFLLVWPLSKTVLSSFYLSVCACVWKVIRCVQYFNLSLVILFLFSCSAISPLRPSTLTYLAQRLAKSMTRKNSCCLLRGFSKSVILCVACKTQIHNTCGKHNCDKQLCVQQTAGCKLVSVCATDRCALQHYLWGFTVAATGVV